MSERPPLPRHQPGPPFSIGVIVLGGGALLLSAALFLGFLLPTDWEAEASLRVAASPERVFAFVDSPEGWQTWTTWPDSGLVREGPPRGAGSMMSWDDEELGSGSFRLVDAEPSEAISYAVEVGGGAMRTLGTITLTGDGDGVVVAWSEQGNLGRNPLMGYWAFFMARAQTTELEKGLDRLAAVTTGPSPTPQPTGADGSPGSVDRRDGEAPADTGSTGAS